MAKYSVCSISIAVVAEITASACISSVTDLLTKSFGCSDVSQSFIILVTGVSLMACRSCSDDGDALLSVCHNSLSLLGDLLWQPRLSWVHRFGFLCLKLSDRGTLRLGKFGGGRFL